MNAFSKPFAFVLVFCATATLLSNAPTFAADGNKPAQETVIGDHIMMQDGRMVMTKGGNRMMMREDVTLTDGAKVMTNGTVILKSGEKTVLKNGDYVTLTGKVVKGGEKAGQ